MKPKKILKSLADLSAAVTGEETGRDEDMKSPEIQVVVQGTPQISQPKSSPKVLPSQGSRYWGLNE